MRVAGVVACGIGLLVAAGAAAQTTPEAAKIIEGDRPAAAQTLSLAAPLPVPTGPARDLFNGRDLSGWEAWLGYADPSVTFQQTSARPLGASAEAAKVFSVVREDGGPAIRAGGRWWGGLVHAEVLGDYHLSLEYKWGPKIWPPSQAATRNNGLLYHSFGEPGLVFGTWRKSVEFQLQHGSVGMAIPLGGEVRARSFVAQDMALPYPHRRFTVGGREIEFANGTPAWNVEHAANAEKPVGEWNRIDLYVLGDEAIHVVNGVPVMMLHGLATVDAEGRRTPLVRGRIQLQSEGAETFFRNIRVEPIRELPKLVVGS